MRRWQGWVWCNCRTSFCTARCLLAAFNEAVRVYNAARAQFPAAVMARLGGFRPAQALALAEGARA